MLIETVPPSGYKKNRFYIKAVSYTHLDVYKRQEGHIDGAILSFHEIQKLKSMEASVRVELYRNNRRAKYEFERLTARSPAMKRTVVAAKVYAQTEIPLFVCGEQGTEREGLAQSIHLSLIHI